MKTLKGEIVEWQLYHKRLMLGLTACHTSATDFCVNICVNICSESTHIMDSNIADHYVCAFRTDIIYKSLTSFETLRSGEQFQESEPSRTRKSQLLSRAQAIGQIQVNARTSAKNRNSVTRGPRIPSFTQSRLCPQHHQRAPSLGMNCSAVLACSYHGHLVHFCGFECT